LHLIMFDIDGTLVDSFEFDEECYFEAVESVLGIEISPDWDDYEHATDAGVLNELIDRFKIPGDKIQIQHNVKYVFIDLVTEYIGRNLGNICEINGAGRFVQYLRNQENCRVAIATGGWEETAKLKLEAAGIDIAGCAFASSSDCVSRIDIMRTAELRASSGSPFISKTYFGDASWDKKASEALNYRFFLVGNRIKHKNQIKDFKDMASILGMLNL
jgi:phosphoglycolate phosphatase-like HAD superfamily hydrolase